MRILIINSEYPPIGGGAGNASAHLSRALARMGQEVTVLTARFGELPHEEMDGDVRVLRAPAMRRHADRSKPLEQFSFIFGGLAKAIPLAKHWRPDACIAFFGVPSGPVALGLKLAYKIPYLVSLRGGDVPGFRPYDFALYHALMRPLIRLVWRRAAAVVANSQGLRQLAQSVDQRVEIRVIPNGVQAGNYSANGRAWSPPHLLLVGRVVYQKGIDLLLDALAPLRGSAWTLSIAGDGPLMSKLKEQAAQLGLAERVHFLGWQNPAQLVELYRRANLFVYPSRHEGMPNAVLEAMASSLPVIASAIAGNEELVVPDDTGLLVPTEDSKALSDALKSLLSDTARRAQMGAAGRQRVEQGYTWENVARQYLDLLESALEKR